jgi:hypothetical protein
MSPRLLKIFISLVLSFQISSSYGWNIICGISVLSFGQADMTTKWEADSAAINGISEFYSAIASLQSINVELLLATDKSPAKNSEIAKTNDALAHFKSSQDLFKKAKTKANQMATPTNPLDKIGTESLKLWDQLANYENTFASNLSSGQLPDLYELHAAIDVVHQIDNLGMRASLMHLATQQHYHTVGGAQARFK